MPLILKTGKNLIMDIDKLIEEKTECFTGNGDYCFTYVTPEDCKKIIEEALEKERSLSVDNVSKRFLMNFNGDVVADIEITNNEPEVFGSMNGWGEWIGCEITQTTTLT